MTNKVVVPMWSTYEISRYTPPTLTEYVRGLSKVPLSATYDESDPTCY
jgi:hypothetical protein